MNLECTGAAETTDIELFGLDGSGGRVTKRAALDMAHRGTLALGNPEMLSRDWHQNMRELWSMLRRAARVYRTNRDAATALGVTSAAFARLCKRLGIATPHQRL